LLIIAGLLITLANLKTAVDKMGDALSPPAAAAARSPSNAPSGAALDSRIRQGIEGIAVAAGTAFAYSAAAIFFASVILACCVATQKYATGSVAAFSLWAYDKCDSRLKSATEGSADVATKLGLAADTLARVAITFEETNGALRELKLFGDKLDSAAQKISEAVSGLPTQMDASMAKISGDVAEGISRGLQHQAQYLIQLYAVYSDHAVTLAKVVEYMTELTANHKAASTAITQLEGMPAVISILAENVARQSTASTNLESAVKDLDRKVDALPAEELTKAAHDLEAAAERLVALKASISAAKDKAEAFVTSGGEKIEGIASVLGQIEGGVRSLLEAVRDEKGATVTSRVDTLLQSLLSAREQITQIRGDLAKVQRSASDGHMPALQAQLETITDQIDALPWFRLMRALRS
jgi:hypothetical protein